MSEDMKTQLSKAFNIPLQKGNEKGKKDYPKQEKKGNPKPQEQHGGKEMPNRYLPLYKDFKKTDYTKPRPMEESAHTGLLFDKFCDHWSGPGSGKPWKPETPPRGDSVKKQFLDAIVKQMANRSDGLLDQFIKRRKALISALNGDEKEFTTSWRFVSGLGMGHVLETGFVWHRILGVPYLPGSSVKGLIRAWADPKTDKKTGEHLGWGDPDMWNDVKRLFGDSDKIGAGSLIVFDAIPVEKPKLEVDIMNPHYGDYYNKKKDDKGQLIPPADYLSPSPIFFLTVARDTTFSFALASRNKDMEAGKKEVARGFALLTEALNNLGAGAKTAVGYGYFFRGE